MLNVTCLIIQCINTYIIFPLNNEKQQCKFYIKCKWNWQEGVAAGTYYSLFSCTGFWNNFKITTLCIHANFLTKADRVWKKNQPWLKWSPSSPNLYTYKLGLEFAGTLGISIPYVEYITFYVFELTNIELYTKHFYRSKFYRANYHL